MNREGNEVKGGEGERVRCNQEMRNVVDCRGLSEPGVLEAVP
jgi:hypothetical protein